MYKRLDSEIYVDIAPENIIYTTDIDLDRFFNLCAGTMDMSFPFSFPTFSGLAADNFSVFISKFNDMCLLKNINEDPRVCAMFSLCVNGPARCWYENLPADSKDTWEHLEAAARGKYEAPLNPVDLQARSVEFHQLVWQQGQELEEYAALIRTKGNVLNKNDGEMAAQFVSGLPGQLAFFVRAQNSATLDEAVASAKQGHSFGYKGLGHHQASSSNSEIHEMRAAIKDLTAAVQSLQVSQMNAAQTQYHQPPRVQDHQPPQAQYHQPPQAQYHQPPQAQYHQHSQQSPSRLYPQPQHQSPAANTCARCGCPGHVNTACNIMDNVRPRPDFTCHKCNQIGHGSTRCKLRGN